jgi:hypothetical protein
MTNHAALPSVIGRTFPVRPGNRVVIMEVQKVILGHAECRSLDLRWTARWPVDRVQRAIEQSAEPAENSD